MHLTQQPHAGHMLRIRLPSFLVNKAWVKLILARRALQECLARPSRSGRRGPAAQGSGTEQLLQLSACPHLQSSRKYVKRDNLSVWKVRSYSCLTLLGFPSPTVLLPAASRQKIAGLKPRSETTGGAPSILVSPQCSMSSQLGSHSSTGRPAT